MKQKNSKKMNAAANKQWNSTDFDIPKFSYRSAFLIFGVTFAAALLAAWLSSENKLWISLAVAAAMSLTVSCSRYFIDTKRGSCRGFYIMTAVLFAAAMLLLYFLPF
ncbi:MAG: hypothetical protein LKE48_09055 [Solobacterium sp.]|jgi:hypothetical protein|nr:hypothetical protein [Solobacterium sp.]